METRSIRAFSALLIAVLLTMWFAVPTAVAKSPKSETKAAAEAERSGPLDLNTASAAELEALPGVGKATAAKIIANRPYAAKNDLVEKGVVSQRTYDSIKGRIVAHRATQAKDREARVDDDRRGARDTARKSEARSSSIDDRDAGMAQPRGDRDSRVWVNTESGIYHRQGDRWYGKTKHGEYMSEREAIRDGYRVSKQSPQ